MAGVAQLVEHRFCKPAVAGSSPFASSASKARAGLPAGIERVSHRACATQGTRGATSFLEGCPSGQREQAVNLPAYAYGGSNPPPSTAKEAGHRGARKNHVRVNGTLVRANLVRANGARQGGASQRKVAVRAGDRVRTGDIQLGRLTLYQLSYSRGLRDASYFGIRVRVPSRSVRLNSELKAQKNLAQVAQW